MRNEIEYDVSTPRVDVGKLFTGIQMGVYNCEKVDWNSVSIILKLCYLS